MPILLVVEDGGGNPDANSYASLDDVSSYHEMRGNDGWLSAFSTATGLLLSDANYADGEIVVIGTKTYTFQDTLTDVDGHIQVGLTEAASIANLAAAINGNTGVPGTDYAASNTPSTEVTAVAAAHKLTVTAVIAGSDANSIVSTTTAANASWAFNTLTGGSEEVAKACIIKATDYIEKRFSGRFRGTRQTVSQGLSWPRFSAQDEDGWLIGGIPPRLIKAVSEYALRAKIYNVLAPDPTRTAPSQDMSTNPPTQSSEEVAATRLNYKRQKVGPLEQELHYSALDETIKQKSGGSALIAITSLQEYPEADLIIEHLLRNRGVRLVRGD